MDGAAGRRYWLGEVPAANGGSNTVALALLPDTGNTIASTRATLLLEHFQNAQAIIMTGIAGGVPFPEKAEHHVRLGDIIVSNRYGVVQYDYVKTERCREGEKEWVENTNRHPPRAPSALFLEAAVYLVAGEMEESKPWLGLIQQACERLGIRRPGEETDTLARSDNPEETVPHPRDDAREPGVPRVFRGPIASANVLLKDPIRRNALRDAFGVKAVEMEGSGISDATWTLEEGYFIVRRGVRLLRQEQRGRVAELRGRGRGRLHDHAPAIAPEPSEPGHPGAGACGDQGHALRRTPGPAPRTRTAPARNAENEPQGLGGGLVRHPWRAHGRSDGRQGHGGVRHRTTDPGEAARPASISV